MRHLCVAALLLLACDGNGPCPSGSTACGSSCLDLAADGLNCGACGHACAVGQRCESGNCAGGPVSCSPPNTGCFNEHGVGMCCRPGEVCVGNPMIVECRESCTTSRDCVNVGGCCNLNHTCGPTSLCLCKDAADCPSGACAPLTNAGDPVGPMICKPNDGALYDGCNGSAACAGSGCCVADGSGNHFCATACTDNTTCGAATCNTYDFSPGTCAGPTACGP